MPGYVQDALQKFKHDPPQRRQDQPYPHTPPEYGAKMQYSKGADDYPLLAKADKKFVQQVTGIFLFYARAFDSTMLTTYFTLKSSTTRENWMGRHSCKPQSRFLEKRLKKKGCYQSMYKPGLWLYEWQPIQFSLVVDDFGVKYVGEANAKHLVNALVEHYEISQDWDGKRYCGLTLEWEHEAKKVHISMPGYVQDALQRFKHYPPRGDRTNPIHTLHLNMGKECNMRREQTTLPY